MKYLKYFRRFLQFIFAGGATLSVGFVSFTGMYFLTPWSIPSCVIAFIFAGGNEGQVNWEGTKNTSKRLLDSKHLDLEIIERYLYGLKDTASSENNIFYKEYDQQKKYIEDLEEDIATLHKKRNSYLPFFEAEWRDYYNTKIQEQKKEIKAAKKEIRDLKLFFLKRLNVQSSTDDNEFEKNVDNLIGDQRDALKKERSRKSAALGVGGVLSVGAGACLGLVSLSAIAGGVASIAALSAITPFGVIVALAAIAGIGAALLTYEPISSFVQDFKVKNYFRQRTEEKESSCAWIVRCVLAVFSVLLGLGATYASVGTWYDMVQDGAKQLGAIDRVANMLRTVFIFVTLLPTIIFNTQNSIESVDKLCKSEFYKLYLKTKEDFTSIRFHNPFHFLEKLIGLTGSMTFFLGHVASIGVGPDRVNIPGLPVMKPDQSIPIGAGNEFLTDFNYRPDEENHTRGTSPLLRLILLPLTILSFTLKCLAFVWDFAFSGFADYKASLKQIFTTPCDEECKQIQKPQLSEAWRRQGVINACDDATDKFGKFNFIQKKLTAAGVMDARKQEAEAIKKQLASGEKLPSTFGEGSFAANRYPFWARAKTSSQVSFEKARAHCLGLSAGAA